MYGGGCGYVIAVIFMLRDSGGIDGGRIYSNMHRTYRCLCGRLPHRRSRLGV